MNPFYTQLKAVLEQRQQQARRLTLFFRDDDVDEDEASLRKLLKLFLCNKTPVNLGVIPGRLTNGAIDLLSDYAGTNPGLLELNQHGWQHLNHECEGRKSEFGPSRTFDVQLADIALGQMKMTAAFRPHWFPVFIPPWNRCTAATGQALDQLGFRVLSRDRSQPPIMGSRFREIPITLDLYRWSGSPRLRSVEELVNELIEQIAKEDRIGLMLHHKIMNEEAFSLVDFLLQTFNRYLIVQCHTFQSLLMMAE